ncbi:MAG: hypothetical protein MMC33_000253 [Icmadophila ericetorum]|nr:hypothetical protein [Icmadophila ericetorum]
MIINALGEYDLEKRADLLQKFERILSESSSLVKIFVSSRNDQDIVSRLQDYPNLRIGLERNTDDIKRFVKTEVGKLIKEEELLRFGHAKEEIKTLIIETVTKGAAGMQDV